MNKEQQQAIQAYHNACNLLAAQVNKQFFDNCRDWRWVGDNVGEVCDFGDNDFISCEGMVIILQYGISYDDYKEWECNSLDHPDKYINLRSWCMGLRHEMLDDNKDK